MKINQLLVSYPKSDSETKWSWAVKNKCECFRRCFWKITDSGQETNLLSCGYWHCDSKQEIPYITHSLPSLLGSGESTSSLGSLLFPDCYPPGLSSSDHPLTKPEPMFMPILQISSRPESREEKDTIHSRHKAPHVFSFHIM